MHNSHNSIYHNSVLFNLYCSTRTVVIYTVMRIVHLLVTVQNKKKIISSGGLFLCTADFLF